MRNLLRGVGVLALASLFLAGAPAQAKNSPPAAESAAAPAAGEQARELKIHTANKPWGVISLIGRRKPLNYQKLGLIRRALRAFLRWAYMIRSSTSI